MKSTSSRRRTRLRARPLALARSHQVRRAAGIAVGALVAIALVWGALPGSTVASQAERHIAYYRYFRDRLTPEQIATRNEALAAIPAPCCDEYSIATCCCPCNLAKSVWGLASRLIAQRGFGAARVQREVERWLATANPNGAAGDACHKGRCESPLHRDGCGGMDERRVS